jgi:prevent-host-death family protein
MCYMDGAGTSTEASVGVRELRQNLSVYLERVAAGTVFRVTDRGRDVALLVPLPGHATTAQRLVASGRATPAGRDLVSLGRPTVRPKRSLSEALREIRNDRL